ATFMKPPRDLCSRQEAPASRTSGLATGCRPPARTFFDRRDGRGSALDRGIMGEDPASWQGATNPRIQSRSAAFPARARTALPGPHGRNGALPAPHTDLAVDQPTAPAWRSWKPPALLTPPALLSRAWRGRSGGRAVAFGGAPVEVQLLEEVPGCLLEGMARRHGELLQPAGVREAVRVKQEQHVIVRRFVGEIQIDLGRRTPGQVEAALPLEAEVAGTGNGAQTVGDIIGQNVRPGIAQLADQVDRIDRKDLLHRALEDLEKRALDPVDDRVVALPGFDVRNDAPNHLVSFNLVRLRRRAISPVTLRAVVSESLARIGAASRSFMAPIRSTTISGSMSSRIRAASSGFMFL